MKILFLNTFIFAIVFKFVDCFHLFSGFFKTNQLISNSKAIVKCEKIGVINSRRRMVSSDKSEPSTVDVDEENDFDEATIDEDVSKVFDTDSNENISSATNATEVDERAKAIKDYESELHKELASLENILRTERLNLARVKDKVCESGKPGFFMVQAQVNDFLRKKDLDQKTRVAKNKREFVEKMLPVVDAFRKSRETAPPLTEREENMHTSFGSLLTGILNVFDKYGFKEFTAEPGSKLVPGKHQIIEARDSDTDGIIIECVRSGMLDNDGEVLRPAQVIASKAPLPIPVDTSAGEESTSGVDSE